MSFDDIHDAEGRCTVDVPADPGGFRERVERAAYEIGSQRLVIEANDQSRALMIEVGRFVDVAHEIDGARGSITTRLTMSFAHRLLVGAAMVLGVFVALPAAIALFSLVADRVARLTEEATAAVGILAGVFTILVPLLLIAGIALLTRIVHKRLLHEAITRRQRVLVSHLSRVSEPEAPYRDVHPAQRSGGGQTTRAAAEDAAAQPEGDVRSARRHFRS